MTHEKKRCGLIALAASSVLLVGGCQTMDGVTSGIAVQTADDDVLTAQMPRSRVIAELREAQRLGLITVGEEDIPQFTETQLRQIAKAGQDAETMQARESK